MSFLGQCNMGVIVAFHEKGQQFLNELPEIRQDLPVSPRVFQALFSQTSKHSRASLADIASTIEKDQGLTVRILTMANSAYYGLQSQVGSVHRAVLLLGLQEIRKMVLLLSIRFLERRLDPELLNVSSHWRHQSDVAHLAKIMANYVPEIDPDELFVIGLLHDLGKVIIALYRPGDWRAILELEASENAPLFVSEDIYWGLDHALIGAITLKSWFLPTSLTEPINWHHAPELAQEFTVQAKVIRLADALVHRQIDRNTDAVDWPEEDFAAKDMHDLRLSMNLALTLTQEVETSGRTELLLQGLGISGQCPQAA